MGTQTQTFRSSSATSTSQTIYTITSPSTPGEEFSQALPNGVKQLMIKCKGSAKLSFTLTSGETGTNSIPIYKGNVYQAHDLNLTGKTVYLACNKASQEVVIEIWT